MRIDVDIKELATKAVKYGPLHVFAETIWNLLLLAKDSKKMLLKRVKP